MAINDYSIIDYPYAIEKISRDYNKAKTFNRVILSQVIVEDGFDRLDIKFKRNDQATGESISDKVVNICPEHVRLDILKRKEILADLEAFYLIIK